MEYDLLVTDLTANASSRIANIRNTYQEVYNLTEFHKYRYELFAKNLDGQSGVSIELTHIRNTELGEDQSFRKRTSDQALLVWNQPPIDTEVFWFRIHFVKVTDFNSFSESENVDEELVNAPDIGELTVSGLKAGFVYTYILQVRDESGNLLDETSHELEFGFVPTMPLNLVEVTEDRTALAISLKWDEPAEFGGTLNVEYVIEVKYQKSERLFARIEGIETTSYDLTGLIVDNSYTFSVFARNDFGLSERSEELTILFLEPPPKAPIVTGVEAVGNKVVITWQQPNNGAA